MPLIQGKSPKAFQKNVETEMRAHPGRQAQNLAIAYAVKRRNMKAKGGAVEKHENETSHEYEDGSKDSEVCEMSEGGHVLSAEARKHIKPSNFALSGGRYPIHDIAHARNALARAAQHASPSEQATIRAKVHAKYPSIGKAHGGEMHYDGGGPVLDPDKLQQAQSSMRNAFNPKKRFADGGESDPYDPSDSNMGAYRTANYGLSKEEHRKKAKELRAETGSPKYMENMARLASFHEKEAGDDENYARGGMVGQNKPGPMPEAEHQSDPDLEEAYAASNQGSPEQGEINDKLHSEERLPYAAEAEGQHETDVNALMSRRKAMLHLADGGEVDLARQSAEDSGEEKNNSADMLFDDEDGDAEHDFADGGMVPKRKKILMACMGG